MLFLDKSFPPNQSSLCKDWLNLPAQYKDQWCQIKWVRLDEPYFVEFTSIKQGNLGDCFIISALISMLDHPNYINTLFEHRNKLGSQVIYLYPQGIKTSFQIDTFIPCINNKPVFVRGGPWVKFIEKALAKLYGCYYALDGGNPAHALFDLTGFPVFEHKSLDIKALQSALQQDYLIIVYTKAIGTHLFLHPEHAYSIMTLNDNYLVIKDTWLCEQFKINEKEFQELFESILICNVQEYYKTQTMNTNKIRGMIQFNLDSKQRIFLQFNQKDLKLQNNSEYSFVRVFICITPSYRYVTGVFQQDRSIFFDLILEQGSYLILFQLNLQSDLTITFEEIYDEFTEIEELIIKNNSLEFSQSRKQLKDSNIFSYFGLIHGIMFLSFKNQTQDQILIETLYNIELKNYSIKNQSISNGKMILTVNENQERVIIFEQTPNKDNLCSYQFKTESQIIKIPIKKNQNFVNLIIRSIIILKIIASTIFSLNNNKYFPNVKQIKIVDHLVFALFLSSLYSLIRAITSQNQIFMSDFNFFIRHKYTYRILRLLFLLGHWN